jgi:signal peptidase I
VSTVEPVAGQDWTARAEAARASAGPRRAIDDRPIRSRPAGGPRRGIEDDTPAPPPLTPGRRVFRLVQEAVIILVVAVIISTLIRTFGVEQFRVPTGSMEQTLYGIHTDESGRDRPGDRIFVTKLGGYDRGDIVVFEDKLGWLSEGVPASAWYKRALEFVGILPDSSKRYLVKRLIGLPGDHVVCCSANGKITVNGQELDEDYLFTYPDGASVAPSEYLFDLIVPADRVFVMGDHRNDSSDSRLHLCSGTEPTPDLGFPAVDDIEGPVVAIAYPFDRMTRFHTPETYAGVPPPTASPPAHPEITVYPTC